jgi:hypothetical protein
MACLLTLYGAWLASSGFGIIRSAKLGGDAICAELGELIGGAHGARARTVEAKSILSHSPMPGAEFQFPQNGWGQRLLEYRAATQ